MNISNQLGAQWYPWHQIYDARGRKVDEHLDEVLAAVAAAGLKLWEQSLYNAAHARAVADALARHKLRMPSIYAGGEFHTDAWPKTVEAVLETARIAKGIGVSIIVSNPNPLPDGQDKTDAQLRVQAAALQTLGEALAKEGMTLAYHTHDPEMRHGAREFHHILRATNPVHVGFCLDNHWVYRGCGHSQVALDDILAMYGGRIVSMHLRQSRNRVWAETVEGGDIDCRPLAAWIQQTGFQGPMILERAIEKGTPTGLDPVEAHRRSAAWWKNLLAKAPR